MAATYSACACSAIFVMRPRRRGSSACPYSRRAALQMLTARSADRSISPTILTADTSWPELDRHRRLEGHDPVDLLLQVEGLGVDLVVGGDQVVGTLEVAVEQDARWPAGWPRSPSRPGARSGCGPPRSPRGTCTRKSLTRTFLSRSSPFARRWGWRTSCPCGRTRPARPVRRSPSVLTSVVKKAVRSLTRAACCMLWVTMTIVYCSLISCIRSSMRAVAIGSSAEQGSSIRITSGSTAMARAMHSRCCCPPDIPSAELLSLERTSSQSAAPRRDRSTISSSSGLLLDPEQAGAVGHVVVDGLRERVRLLEDHPDPPADLHRRDGRVVQVDAVEQDGALDAGRLDEVVHAVEAAEQRGLAAAGRADEGRDLVLHDVEPHVAHGAEVAVEHGQVLHLEHLRVRG